MIIERISYKLQILGGQRGMSEFFSCRSTLLTGAGKLSILQHTSLIPQWLCYVQQRSYSKEGTNSF